MKIKDISIREIFDSRAESTIEIGIAGENADEFLAQIPSGKSRGKREAAVFKSSQAIRSLNKIIKPKILNKTFKSIKTFDEYLLKLDGTRNKAKLGGNVILGLSIAFTKALADFQKKSTWRLLNQEFFPKIAKKRPLIFSNLINGGSHTNNSLNIQEYMAVVEPKKSYTESIKKLVTLYRDLAKYLCGKYRIDNMPIGDEGGCSLDFASNFGPILVLEQQIFRHKYQNEFQIALDAAASSFYKNGKYSFENKKIKTSSLRNIYLSYFKKSRLLMSIEDPFAETDHEGFEKLKAALPKSAWVVGDDLTATNPGAIEKSARQKLINAVIIKPNQIGTVTETCEAINIAKRHGLKFIVSHRSGETEDNFIIHLAKASGADGVKIGAPVKERIFKFNGLVRVYD